MKITKEQFFGIVRHGLTFVGAILVAKGQVDDGQWYEISGAAVSLAAVVWSILDKKQSV